MARPFRPRHSPKDHGKQRPSAGEAVKAGEAARAAGRLYSLARRWRRDFAVRPAASLLAVEMRHRLGGIARTGRRLARHGGGDRGKIGGAELGVLRAERLIEPVAPARADERHDRLALRRNPGDGGLGDADSEPFGDGAQSVDEREIGVDIVAMKARTESSKIALCEGAL